MAGNSHEVHPQFGRRDERESWRCSLRQNNNATEVYRISDRSQLMSQYVLQRTDAPFKQIHSASYVLTE